LAQPIGISVFSATQKAAAACDPPGITFHPAGKDAISYDFVPGSAALVEDSGDDDEAGRYGHCLANRQGSAAAIRRNRPRAQESDPDRARLPDQHERHGRARTKREVMLHGIA